MSLYEHDNIGLIYVKFGIPVNTRKTNKRKNTNMFYIKVRSNLRGSNKLIRIIISSVVSSKISRI
jgi:hypothetical protein